MSILSALRKGALAIAVAALVAGCAAPPEENRPGDLHCDGDRDGIPDGQSPVEGANETCDDDPAMPDEQADGAPVNDSGQMPGLLP